MNRAVSVDTDLKGVHSCHGYAFVTVLGFHGVWVRVRLDTGMLSWE